MPNRYDPNIHKRRSIRLKNYDYSSPGAYFITLCAKKRECIFGKIKDDVIHLNNAGRMVESAWNDLPNHHGNILLGTFIVMPNHLHGIILINDDPIRRGKACLAQKEINTPVQGMAGHTPAKRKFGQPVASSLSTIIGSFKSAATRIINKSSKTHGLPLWQRNYYDHIIRDEKSLEKAREYIVNNPWKWDNDDENPDKK